MAVAAFINSDTHAAVMESTDPVVGALYLAAELPSLFKNLCSIIYFF
jgi:hypothetical protein